MARHAPVTTLAVLGILRTETRDEDRAWLEGWSGDRDPDFEQIDDGAAGRLVAWRVRGVTREAASLGRSKCGRHRAIIAGRVESPATDANAFADRLAEDAAMAYEDLAGPCVVLAIDETEGASTLIRPDCGQRPLSYALLEDGVAFASNGRTLVTHPEVGAAPDWTAISQYLTFGLVWGERTFFDRVRRLSPGARLDVKGGKAHHTAGHWKFQQSPSSDAECIDLIDSSLTDAVERAWSGAEFPTLCLSAGLDSRTILAIAHRLGVDLRCITDCVEGSIEFELASRMCGIVGAEHSRRLLEIDATDQILAGVPMVAECSDGEGSIQNGIMLDSGRKYGFEFGIDRVIRGHGGELMKMVNAYDFALPESISTRGDVQAARDFIRLRMQAIFDAPVLATLRGELAEAMSGNVGTAFDAAWDGLAQEAPDPTQRAGLMLLRCFDARVGTASMGCMRQSVDLAMPFLDEQFVRPLLSTPPRLRQTTALQVELIRRNSPRLLEVPDGIVRVPLGAPRWRRQVARAARAIGRRLGVTEIDVPEKWLVKRLETFIPEMLLEERSLARPHVDPDGMRALLSKPGGRSRSESAFLNRMCSIEFHLRSMESLADEAANPDRA